MREGGEMRPGLFLHGRVPDQQQLQAGQSAEMTQIVADHAPTPEVEAIQGVGGQGVEEIEGGARMGVELCPCTVRYLDRPLSLDRIMTDRPPVHPTDRA